MVALTAGPKRTEQMLREALAKGADEAVRVASEDAGHDVGTVARIERLRTDRVELPPGEPAGPLDERTKSFPRANRFVHPGNRRRRDHTMRTSPSDVRVDAALDSSHRQR